MAPVVELRRDSRRAVTHRAAASWLELHFDCAMAHRPGTTEHAIRHASASIRLSPRLTAPTAVDDLFVLGRRLATPRVFHKRSRLDGAHPPCRRLCDLLCAQSVDATTRSLQAACSRRYRARSTKPSSPTSAARWFRAPRFHRLALLLEGGERPSWLEAATTRVNYTVQIFDRMRDSSAKSPRFARACRLGRLGPA